MATEAWLRGPIPDVLPELMPAAHMLVQSAEELNAAAEQLAPSQLWATPGGAASIGFHLRHIAGATDRLLTYARGEALNDAQRAVLSSEKEVDAAASVTTLLAGVQVAIEQALAALRSTTRDQLFTPRPVGRAQLPSNVIGLLYHVAEHTVRHTGQVIATARALRDGQNA
jgi:uncharacterized damage-inducible protein DinB